MKLEYCKLRGKIPIEKDWINNGYKWEEIKDHTGPIGLIIPEDYVVVDIDNSNTAMAVINNDQVVAGAAVHLTPKGAHLIYKRPDDLDISNWSRKPCALGINVDYRVRGGQIVLPGRFSPGREVIRPLGPETSQLPTWFYPVPGKPFDLETTAIQEGGRDCTLTSLYGRILNTMGDDSDEVLRVANTCLDDPLPDKDIEKIINSIKSKDARNPSKTVFQGFNWYTQGGKLIPHKLAEHIISINRILYTPGGLYIYNGANWEVYHEMTLARHIGGYLRTPRVASINEVANQVKILAFNNADIHRLRKDRIVFNNITTDFRGNIAENDPEDYITFRIHGDYTPGATAPVFEKFIERSVKVSSIPLLQEMLGIIISGAHLAKRFFVCHGPTDCGKSVLAELILNMLGHDNVSSVSLSALCDPSNRWAAGEMHGKTLNLNTDIPANVLRDTSLLKQLTGDSTIRYERKGADAFQGAVSARLLFIANQLPASMDNSDAFMRRLAIIKFNESVPLSEQDPRLLDKLIAEIPGIIAWAMEGLKRVLENNNVTLDQVEIENYREFSNNVLSFIKEHCEDDVNSKIPTNTLFTVYKRFCEDNRYYAKNIKGFVQELEAQGYKRYKDAKARGIQGLKLIL